MPTEDFFASSSLRFVSLTLRDLVQQTADKKRLRTSTQELYFECHLTHYTLRMSYILFPLSVCLSRLLDIGGTGRLAIFTVLSVPACYIATVEYQ